MRSAVFKLPLTALRFPAALWAKAVLRAASKSINMAAARTQAGGHRRRCKRIIFLVSLRRSELHKCCVIVIAITSSCTSEPGRSRFPCGKRVRWLGWSRLTDLGAKNKVAVPSVAGTKLSAQAAVLSSYLLSRPERDARYKSVQNPVILVRAADDAPVVDPLQYSSPSRPQIKGDEAGRRACEKSVSHSSSIKIVAYHPTFIIDAV